MKRSRAGEAPKQREQLHASSGIISLCRGGAKPAHA